MDLHSLDTAVQVFFSAGLAASMQRVYRTGNQQFLQFCRTYQIAQPFTVTERVMCGHIHGEGLAPGVVKDYLADVRHSQIAVALGDLYRGKMPHL